MSNLKNNFSELVALTQLYLLREYNPSDKLVIDPQTHAYFRNTMKNSVASPKINQEVPPIETQRTSYTSSEKIPNVSPRVTQQPVQSNPKISAPPTVVTQQPSKPLPETIVQPVKDKPVKAQVRSFNLEPLQPTEATNEWNDFKQVLNEHFPTYTINEKIPPDTRAQKIKSSWQMEQTIPPVIILSFNDQNNHLAFIKNIAKAITLNLAPARVISAITIEQENGWKELLNTPQLRLIITSDYGLYLLPGLMQHYKEVPKTAQHFLHRTPLLLLSDLSLYLKEPQLKPLLWRAIQQNIGNK